jgi:hypothetical protein
VHTSRRSAVLSPPASGRPPQRFRPSPGAPVWSPRDTTLIAPPRCAPAHDGLSLSIVVTRRQQVRLRKVDVTLRTVTTNGVSSAPGTAHTSTRRRRIYSVPGTNKGFDFVGLPTLGGRIDPGDITGLRLLHRIEREARPPMRSADGRGRPPQNLLTHVTVDRRYDSPHRRPGWRQYAQPRPPQLTPSAAAGCPPGERGPRSPGTGGGRRASG